MPTAAISDNSLASNPQTLQQWNQLLESLFGTPSTNTNTNSSGTSAETNTTTSSSAATDPILAFLAQILPGTTGGINNPQSQALISSIFQQFREGAGGLSGIQAAGNSAGVYNSSTQGLLANDAMARAVSQSAGVIQQGQLGQQNTAVQLLNALLNSTRATTANRAGTTANNQGQSSSRGGSLGSSAGKGALGAAAAGAAARRILDRLQGDKKPADSGQNDDPGAIESFRQAGRDSGEGRSDSSDNTSALGAGGSGYNEDDPGAIQSFDRFEGDGGLGSDPFGVGGYNDFSEPNFDFIDIFSGENFGESSTANVGDSGESFDFFNG